MRTNIPSFLLSRSASIRVGFATNSSSSHSIVVLPSVDVEVIRILRPLGSSSQGGNEVGLCLPDSTQFGWEPFALTEPREKEEYLLTALYGQLSHTFRMQASVYELPDDVRKSMAPIFDDASTFQESFCMRLASNILDVPPCEVGYIDHDSCFSLPVYRGAHMPHVGMARWFLSQLVDPNVVILGGNDNSTNETIDAYRSQSGELLYQPTDDEYQSRAFVQDEGSYWLIFDPGQGTKLRVLKEPGPPPAFSARPELIDLKITDYCNVGCKYCYQGSTKNGKHCDWTYHVDDLFRKLKPLEVAIGGGEPADHPQLEQIVRHLHDAGISVNLTTRKPHRLTDLIWSHLSGVGISIDRAADVQKYLKFRGKAKQLVFHVVLGSIPTTDVLEILDTVQKQYLGVLLLDFKRDGFGKDFSPHPYDDFPEKLAEHAKEHSLPRIGIDTPLVERFGSKLVELLDLDARLLSPGEGMFSMYIDFVSQTFAKASYGDCERYPLKFNTTPRAPSTADNILEVFQSWHTHEG